MAARASASSFLGGLFSRLLGWRPGASPARIPETLWKETLARHAFLGRLTVDEQKRLKTLAEAFLAQKEFTTGGGLVLSDALCVDIAAQGCLPVLELGLAAYGDWVGIILYPDEFIVPRQWEDEDGVVHEANEVLSGEAWPGGPLIISWRDAQMTGQGYNVVIHEFAHKLDMQNGEADGMPAFSPALHGALDAAAWDAVFLPTFEHFAARVEAGETSDIDPYAASDPAECFAVFSEAFFDQPAVVDREYPAFYTLLARYYRQDPLQRAAHSASAASTAAG